MLHGWKKIVIDEDTRTIKLYGEDLDREIRFSGPEGKWRAYRRKREGTGLFWDVEDMTDHDVNALLLCAGVDECIGKPEEVIRPSALGSSGGYTWASSMPYLVEVSNGCPLSNDRRFWRKVRVPPGSEPPAGGDVYAASYCRAVGTPTCEECPGYKHTVIAAEPFSPGRATELGVK